MHPRCPAMNGILLKIVLFCVVVGSVFFIVVVVVVVFLFLLYIRLSAQLAT